MEYYQSPAPPLSIHKKDHLIQFVQVSGIPQGGADAVPGAALIGGRGSGEQEEHFQVPFGSGDYRRGGVMNPDVFADEIAPEGFQRGDSGAGGSDDSVEALFGGALELGFGQGQKAGALGKIEKAGCGTPQGAEGQIGDGEVRRRFEMAGVNIHDIGALPHSNAGVGANFPGELIAAHIHGMNDTGAPGEQAVGEAAGGGSGVEAHQAGGIQAQCGKGGIEFLASSADEASRDAANGGIRGDGGFGVSNALAVHEDFPAENGGVGVPGAQLGETLGDEFEKRNSPPGFRGQLIKHRAATNSAYLGCSPALGIDGEKCAVEFAGGIENL